MKNKIIFFILIFSFSKTENLYHSLKINNLPGIYDYLKPAKKESVNINFINFNNDRDGDGIPNTIDREPDNPNN